MIELKLEHQIARLVLNRPEKHNSFDDVLIAELLKVLEQVASNSSIRVLILSARGKSFCAGADLGWMQRMAGYSRDQNIEDARMLGRLMQRLYTMPVPTVGIVQGAAYGGGVGLAACCDILLATSAAKFCLSEVKLGLIPAVISPYIIRALGEKKAQRLFITAEIFSAEQAQEWGLVDEISAEEAIEVAAARWASLLINNGPMAMQKAKELVRDVANRPITADLIEETVRYIADQRASEEAKSGLAAFFSKTKPQWIS